MVMKTNLIYLMLFVMVCMIVSSLLMNMADDDDWYDDVPFIKSYNDENVKRIMLWTSKFGDKRWGYIPVGESRDLHKCGVNVTCRVYPHRPRHPHLYDALIFHGRDPQPVPVTRSPHQVYVMFLHESPVHRGNSFIKGGNFYNWTATYSRRSDFAVPYLAYRLRRPSEKVNKVNLPQMTQRREPQQAMVGWVVSHCDTHSKRELYVEALRHHIKVDIFGQCGKSCEILQKDNTVSCVEALFNKGHYKFYLAFENSVCRDYITEKAHNPLRLGMVPIVYGCLSTEEYASWLPSSSFIDVRNFSSPRHLAEYLQYLDGNDAAYMAYHKWRELYVPAKSDIICDICQALHNSSLITRKNVDWAKFWDPETECDATSVGKVIGPRAGI